MFQTLELHYLNKLREGKVRDFSAPQPLHRIQVERLGDDGIKPSAEVSGKFPVPITPLVGNFAIEPCEFTDSTPPIPRPFHFTADGFIEFAEFVQGVFQGVGMVYLLAGVQRQIGLHSEFDLGIDQIHSLYYIVCSYTFTRSGQNFFGGVICHNIEPKRSNTITKDLDIADVAVPIARVVIQDIPADKDKLLFRFVPFLEGNTNCAFWNDRKFSVWAFFKNLVARLELRRAVFLSLLELRRSHAFPASPLPYPSKETLVGDVDTDNHLIQRIARDPRPVLLRPLEQLRQVRLQPIPASVFTIDAVIPPFQRQEVVMDIPKVIQQIPHALMLRVVAYLICVGSHSVTSYQSLTPNEWVGRHVTLRLRSLCLPTGIKESNIKREYDKAIADFNEVIEREPDCAEAYYDRGNAYWWGKVDFDKAMMDYTKAIELKPDYAEAYYNRGTLYVEDDAYDEAIEDFGMAIRFDPEHSDAHGYRADLYRDRGEYGKAVEGYTMEIELRLGDPEIYYDRGETYGAKGEYDKSIADFSKALKLHPEFTEAYSKRALAYFRIGKFACALQDYDKVLELNPKSTGVYAARGIISLHIEEWESAKLDLTFARNLRVDIIAEFHKIYESVTDFEEKNDIQLPEDIAVMLRR